MDPRNDILNAALKRNHTSHWQKVWSTVASKKKDEREWTLTTTELEKQAMRKCLPQKIPLHHKEEDMSRMFEGLHDDLVEGHQTVSLFKNHGVSELPSTNKLKEVMEKVATSGWRSHYKNQPTPKKASGKIDSHREAEQSPSTYKRRKMHYQDVGSHKKKNFQEQKDDEDPELFVHKPRPNSFRTARTVLIEEQQKSGVLGKSVVNKTLHGASVKNTFLTKKPIGGGGGGLSKCKFNKPFKQYEDSEVDVDGLGDRNHSKVLSNRTLEMLADANGEIPEALRLFDLTLVESICSEILQASTPVAWDDIVGQEKAKQLVREMVVWPMLNPELFTGARTPPRGILLFGPPGTGKTMIGKAIASNIEATFFSISASSLASKWIGDGEKMVRILFAVAQHLQPSVVFIDEIDSILSSRKSDGGEHESSRRIKTELLIQLDGCNPSVATSRTLLIGATNRPEELDEAARRRMPKQLYIELPCAEARKKIILHLLKEDHHELGATEMEKIARNTDGYSGSDLKALVQEVCIRPLREMGQQNGGHIKDLKKEDLRPIKLKDFRAAVMTQKASVNKIEIQRYIEYNQKYGAKLASVQPKDGNDDDDDENW